MKTRHATNYGGLILRNEIWHIRTQIKGVTIAESTHTGNRREAERILAKKRTELLEQVVLGGKKPIKLHAAIDLFVKSRSHLPSAAGCKTHIAYFKSIPNHNLDKVTDLELAECISRKRAEGYAESTLKVSVTYFNAMIKYVSEMNFTARKKMKPIKHDSGKVRWLRQEEIDRFLAALSPDLAKDEVLKAQKQENLDLVLLLLDTGGRLTEISDMPWSAVDFEAGTVFMKRKKGSISGTIAMTKRMREVLTRRRALDKVTEFIFPTKLGKQNNKWVRPAVKRAQLSDAEGTVSLHTLRHTRACHLLQAGLGLLELKEFLGHKDIASTMVYSHLIKSDVMSKAARLMNQAAAVADPA